MNQKDPLHSNSPGRWESALGILLLLLQGVLLAWSAWRHSPTQDEVAHLPGGLAIWRYGDCGLYRVNPPLTRGIAALPLLLVHHEEDWTGYRPGHPLRQEWRMASQFIEANGERSLWLFTLARWTCIPLVLLGGILCWHWGRQISGPVAGLTALFLWIISPNILGHGSLITPDIPATSCGLLAVYLFQQWRKDQTVPRAFLAGVGLGLALLSKTYWIILFVIWPLVVIADVISGPAASRPVARQRGVGQLLLLLAVGLNVLNLGYGFQGTGTRLGDLPFYSRFLAGESRNPESDPPANRFRGTSLGRIPLPFPADYVTGIDTQKADIERGKWSYLMGEVRDRGWWYYYLVGLGVKVPLGTLLLATLGGLMLYSGRFRREPTHYFERAFRSDLGLLIIVSLALFVLVSSQTGFSRHVRYVFPVLPTLYLLGGVGVAEAIQRSASNWQRFTAVLGLLLALGSLRTYPHSLSYFNELAGGNPGGDRILIDSNLDWGQDLIYVKEWVASHPECRPIWIDWLGYARLKSFGLEIPLMKPGQAEPGWYIISRHQLHAPRRPSNQFQNQRPADRIGGSFHVYDVE